MGDGFHLGFEVFIDFLLFGYFDFALPDAHG